MTGVLIDTNVLVYAYDRSEPEKQRRAIEVLERLKGLNTGYLSVQCLAEFFRAATRAARPILTVDVAAQQVEALSLAWPVFTLSALVVREAVRGAREHRLAYWDAQLWATARLNQVPVIFSEDFAANSRLEGVRFVNPFAEDFDPALWA